MAAAEQTTLTCMRFRFRRAKGKNRQGQYEQLIVIASGKQKQPHAHSHTYTHTYGVLLLIIWGDAGGAVKRIQAAVLEGRVLSALLQQTNFISFHSGHALFPRAHTHTHTRTDTYVPGILGVFAFKLVKAMEWSGGRAKLGMWLLARSAQFAAIISLGCASFLTAATWRVNVHKLLKCRGLSAARFRFQFRRVSSGPFWRPWIMRFMCHSWLKKLHITELQDFFIV